MNPLDSSVMWQDGLLVLPRVRVQNANAISSPMTWGFPSITAFTGLMTALERKLGPDFGMQFTGVGVVCHGFEAQVTEGGYTRSFCLTRNPVLADGSTAGIVEEGRVHLELTLIFTVYTAMSQGTAKERAQKAQHCSNVLAGMRLAGGSVMPPVPGQRGYRPRPTLEVRQGSPDEQRQAFRRMARRCLPGFALVSRDDLLARRLSELQQLDPQATVLDAWLDFSRWNHRPVEVRDENQPDAPPSVVWQTDRREGWTVPMPVGYAALSAAPLPAGAVAGARNPNTPFRFVESVYSIGQWIGPHRLHDLRQLIWEPRYDPAAGLYRCVNGYSTPLTH